jgi:hypothetical protein
MGLRNEHVHIVTYTGKYFVGINDYMIHLSFVIPIFTNLYMFATMLCTN